jgi:hypothetical protein
MKNHGAMDYEYLVRRAFQCGRSYEKGADADIYRKLERSYGHFLRESEAERTGKPKTWNKSVSELETEYKSDLRVVAGYVDAAIAKALQNYSGLFSADQQEVLKESRKRLTRPTPEDVEDVIEKAQDIMVEAKIFPA